MSRYDFTAGDEVTAAKANKAIRAGSYNAGETINGATLPVACYQNTTDNEFYACDGNDTAKMRFIGFAISNGTDGNSIDIQFNDIVNGFTGLTEGSLYYVQDDKTIGITPGTHKILVGRAISETELFILKATELEYANGTTTYNLATASGTQNIAHGLGRIPKKIRITGIKDYGYTTGINVLSYNGTIGACVRRAYVASASYESVGTTLKFYLSAAIAHYATGTVTFDATNIIITWVKTESPTGTVYIMWEAEV